MFRWVRLDCDDIERVRHDFIYLRDGGLWLRQRVCGQWCAARGVHLHARVRLDVDHNNCVCG